MEGKGKTENGSRPVLDRTNRHIDLEGAQYPAGFCCQQQQQKINQTQKKYRIGDIMLEQSDHMVRDLSLAHIAHKENWLSVGKFYRTNSVKSLDLVKIVQYADSFPAHCKLFHAPL